MPMRLLVSDIGGSNSRFAIFETDGKGRLGRGETVWLKTHGASSASELLEQLFSSGFTLHPSDVPMVVLAVAGPVQKVEGGEHCTPPNIPWEIDSEALRRHFGFKALTLINDFAAQGYACRSPIIHQAQAVLAGSAHQNTTSSATLAVIGAGTGLGKCALVPQGGDSSGYVAVPSEGGHTDFPFTDETEFKFGQFLRKKTGRKQVIGDMVVSGSGLALLHCFLTGEERTPEEVPAILAQDEAHETLRYFAKFYGRVCRDYALEVLATGGVYIAGGVAARTPALVMHPEFAREFHLSDNYRELLEQIPVRLIMDQDSGLWGAAVYGLQRMGLPLP
jgi:glucokinase